MPRKKNGSGERYRARHANPLLASRVVVAVTIDAPRQAHALLPSVSRTVRTLCSNVAFQYRSNQRRGTMKKLLGALALPLLLNACAQFHNADAGQPEVEKASSNSVDSIVQCMTDEAQKHDAAFKKTPIPQGVMMEFGDSNVVKIRFDNGETSYRYYPGQRHTSNLWIEGASKKCSP
jgi:hypothetical protein